MTENNYKFIVYTRFNSKDNIYYPCLCENISEISFMEDTLLLQNVYALKDMRYEQFHIKNLYVRTENILYICEGKIYYDEDRDSVTISDDDLAEEKLILLNKDEE